MYVRIGIYVYRRHGFAQSGCSPGSLTDPNKTWKLNIFRQNFPPDCEIN